MEKFSERLTYLMSDVLMISGNALAKELNLNQGLVSRYRKGTTQPPAEFIMKLCNHFKISANWLLLDSGPIRLPDITASPYDDWMIKKVEEKKALMKDFDEIIECIKQLKQKQNV